MQQQIGFGILHCDIRWGLLSEMVSYAKHMRLCSNNLSTVHAQELDQVWYGITPAVVEVDLSAARRYMPPSVLVRQM